MTDYGADVSRGIIPFTEGSYTAIGYAVGNPAYTKGIYDRLIKKYPELLDDFIEFSLTQNGPQLISAIAQKTGRSATSQEFLRWFREDAGLNVRAIIPLGAVGITATGLTTYLIIVPKEPSIQLGPDIFVEDEEVTITSIQGPEEPGTSTTITVIETEGGVVSPEQDKLKEIWALEPISAQSGLIKSVYAQEDTLTLDQIQALPALEIFPQTYELTIPENISDGEYKLTAYLYKEGSNEILDSDFEIITVGEQTAGTEDSNNPLIPDFIEEFIEDIIEAVTEGLPFAQDASEEESNQDRQIELEQESPEQTIPAEEPDTEEIELSPSVSPSVTPSLSPTPTPFPEASPTPTLEPQGFEDIVLPTQTQEYSQTSPSPTEEPEPTEPESTQQPVKQILRVLVNNEEQDTEDIQAGGIDFELPLIPNQPNQSIQIPVQVVFNDGTSKYLVYTFNYLTQISTQTPNISVPPQPEEPEIPIPSPEQTPEPTDIIGQPQPTDEPEPTPFPTQIPVIQPTPIPEPTPEPECLFDPLIDYCETTDSCRLWFNCPEPTPEPPEPTVTPYYPGATNVPEPTEEEEPTPEPTEEPGETPSPVPQRTIIGIGVAGGQRIGNISYLQTYGLSYSLPNIPNPIPVNIVVYFDDGGSTIIPYTFNYNPGSTGTSPVTCSISAQDCDGDCIRNPDDFSDNQDSDDDGICTNQDSCPLTRAPSGDADGCPGGSVQNPTQTPINQYPAPSISEDESQCWQSGDGYGYCNECDDNGCNYDNQYGCDQYYDAERDYEDEGYYEDGCYDL